jgi:hypothetical protein
LSPEDSVSQIRSVLVVGLAVFGLAGCSDVEMRSEPVAVTTKVTHNGRPVKDVLLCFTPHTAMQLGGEFPLDAAGNVAPGRTGDEIDGQQGDYPQHPYAGQEPHRPLHSRRPRP